MRLTSAIEGAVRSASADPAERAGDAEGPDENLHFGRSWHRYGYCFRRAEGLRVLDAGCGAGRSSLALARLNPGASVLGIDGSYGAISRARREAAAVGPRFELHDPAEPLPEAFGRFDFVVCRGGLARADDPARVVRNLARALDDRGLLLLTLPTRRGRAPARALRRAVDALAPPGAGLVERVRVGLEVAQALRPDHPVREFLARSQRPDHGPATDLDADTDAAPAFLFGVLDALTVRRDWALDEAVGLLDQAGLTFLYAATPWPWRPDRAFDPGDDDAGLIGRVARLDPAAASGLIDAVDPPALGDQYQLYACPAASTPEVPGWPRTRRDDPAGFDRLIPHATGLARPEPAASAAVAQGRTLFRSVSGALGEFDRISVLRLAAVDGRTPCGAIDRNLAAHRRAGDDAESRQISWINLADHGLILLEPPDDAGPGSSIAGGSGI